MQKTIYQMKNFKLNIIKTDKFKNITIKVIFKRKIIKEELTIRSLLFRFLVYSSKKYNTNRKRALAQAALYEPILRRSTKQYGEIITNDISIEILDEKYTENKMLSKSIDFFLEFIFNPNFEKNKCNEQNFNEVKDNLKNKLNGDKENKNKYTIDQMLINTSEDIIHYELGGYLEDIDKINAIDVYNYYQKIINEDELEVYVIGDVNEEEIQKIMNEKIELQNKREQIANHTYEHKLIRKKPIINIENDNLAQSKLAVCYKTPNLTDEELEYFSIVFNILLGGGMNSKLFKEVREKNSLCYSIGSDFVKGYNILYIIAGIDGSKFELTKNLIIDIIESMKKGDFDEEDLKVAKQIIIEGYKSYKDSVTSILNRDYYYNLKNLPEEEKQINIIEKINKQKIINFSNKLIIDNIFLLKGENYEEN